MLRVAVSMQQVPCRSFGLFDNMWGSKKEEPTAKPEAEKKQDEQTESQEFVQQA